MAQTPYIRLTRKVNFCAGHFYHVPTWTEEENCARFRQCGNPLGHGHNYTAFVTIGGPLDPETGMVVNLTDIKTILEKVVVNELDHKNLNHQVPYFKGINPTLENLSTYLWQAISTELQHYPQLTLDYLKLVENDTLFVECMAA